MVEGLYRVDGCAGSRAKCTSLAGEGSDGAYSWTPFIRSTKGK